MKLRLGSHTCPPPNKGALPSECLKAAETGNVDEIINFLDNGGDINSSDATGKTMLFSACGFGRHQVVRELLKRPDIHVNISFDGITPILMAAGKGHYECVRLLLEESHQCQANYRIRCKSESVGLPMSPIGMAAISRHWKVFNLLLKKTDAIIPFEIPPILDKAAECEEWDIVREVLKPEISYQSDIFFNILVKAYDLQIFDIVHTVFERSMNHDGNKYVLFFVREVFLRKDWENLEAFLKVLDPTIKLDVSMAEALLKKYYKEVSYMLETKKYDSATLNGVILMASLHGCSKEIANTLLSDLTRYSENALEYAFLMSSLFNRMYFLPKFLREKEFSYNILFSANDLAVTRKHKNISKMLNLALSEKNCELFPNFTKSGSMMKALLSEDGDL